MLTNTLLLYMTQEALAKARAKLATRRVPAQRAVLPPQWVRPKSTPKKKTLQQTRH